MTLLEHLTQKFSNFSFADALQIILLALTICFVLIYVKARNAKNFSYMITIYYIVILGASAFNAFPDALLVVLVCLPLLALALLFGPEIKRDLFKISWKNYSSHLMYVDADEIKSTIQHIVRAAQTLSKKDTGATIIIVPDKIAEHILDSGTSLRADVSYLLLEAIFMKSSPLHDGAVIIKGNKILAAGCYLPLSQANLPKELGTRHRSALGITEVNPSITSVVVSEQTGIISSMHDGKIMRYLDAERLEHALEAAFMLDGGAGMKTFWRSNIDESE